MDANIEPLWTTQDVARYLRVKPATVLALARKKEIPAIRVGRVYRFRRSEIVHWLEEKRQQLKTSSCIVETKG